MVVNHGEVCWYSSLWIMVCYAVSVVVNHGELCSASGRESWWAMLSQWLWNIVSYAELSVWESWCAMLSQWLWISMLCWTRCVEIMVCYSEPVVGNHGVNAVPVVMNHCLLFCASRCEPWRCILRQWLWIIMFYSVPVGVTHGELCWTSGCESWCVILCQ
jgi:hypothetical protein